MANVMSQPSAFWVARICMMPALLSRPAIGSWSATISAAARRTLDRVGQVAHNRNRVPALLLDGLLHLVELAAVAADQDDGAVPGQLRVPCGEPYPEVGPVMTYAGRAELSAHDYSLLPV